MTKPAYSYKQASSEGRGKREIEINNENRCCGANYYYFLSFLSFRVLFNFRTCQIMSNQAPNNQIIAFRKLSQFSKCRMHVVFNFYVFHIIFNLFVVSITISLDTCFVFKRNAIIFSILDIKLIFFLLVPMSATLYLSYPKYTYEITCNNDDEKPK